MAERKPGAAGGGAPAAAFFGPPRRLRLVASGPQMGAPQAVRLPAELEPYVDPRHPPLRASGARDPGRARLRLAPQTPPGQYKVAVEFAGGRRQQMTVTVEPRPRLRVLPGTLRLAGAPGAKLSARLLLENRGNETLAIDESLVTGLFDDDGIEAALAAVYRMETDELDKIVGAGFARLRQAHGGLLKLRVREGAGPLVPGERRSLLLETTLGAKLAPRHGYHGTLDLGPHTIAVELSVLAPQPPGGRQ